MERPRTFYRSTIGKKVIMAVTGIVLVGYVIGHAIGNLLIFRGASAVNDYAAYLKSNVPLLWTVRGVLFISVGLHIAMAVQLASLARRGRPVSYEKLDPQASTFAARTMRWGGLALGLFVVYHVLHFTTGTLHPRFDHLNVYGNVIGAFRLWWVSAIYLLAMVALGLHLYHGTWSVFQTLGVSHPSANRAGRQLATIVALAVSLGFISIPLGVLGGILE